jgi:hypothetical protein
MMLDNSFGNYAWAIGLATPLILAAIGGLVWAIVNWKKASNPALFAAVACAVLMLFSCIFPALHSWGPRLVIDRNAGLAGIQRWIWVSRTISVSQSLCWGLCVGALVFAVFAGRAAESRKNTKKRPRDEEDDEDDEDRPRSKPRKKDDEGFQEKPRPKRPPRDEDD